MDIPTTAITTLQLAHSLIPQRESSTKTRRRIYESVAGQRISFKPEIGEEIQLQLRNCAFDEDGGATFLTVAVNDPQRPEDLFQIETDFRYHYTTIYARRELSNLLVDELNFVEIGPEDFKVELRVESTDSPTLQIVFERVESILSQIHTEYHQYLRAQYETYHDEVSASKSFENGEYRYEVTSDIDDRDLIPQPGEHDFSVQRVGDEMDPFDRIQVGDIAHDYVKYVVKAEAGGEDYFVLV